jgi:hypothetical protein
MDDLSKLHPNALSAAMRGGTDGWGEIGSADRHIRYSEPISSRRRCHCGCKTRVTHLGMANGIGLTEGCQLYVTRWVKDPMSAYRIGRPATSHNEEKEG